MWIVLIVLLISLAYVWLKGDEIRSEASDLNDADQQEIDELIEAGDLDEAEERLDELKKEEE